MRVCSERAQDKDEAKGVRRRRQRLRDVVELGQHLDQLVLARVQLREQQLEVCGIVRELDNHRDEVGERSTLHDGACVCVDFEGETASAARRVMA